MMFGSKWSGAVQVPHVHAVMGGPSALLGVDESLVLERYARLVCDLEIVQAVLVDSSLEGIGIWTIIDAEPLEFAPRKPVYNAELQASQVAPDAKVLFHLINQREYREDELNQTLPVNGLVVWQRPRPT